MKFKIEIECDNAAFEDGVYGPGEELGRILDALSDKLGSLVIRPGDSESLHDSNGNRVGQWSLTGGRTRKGSARGNRSNTEALGPTDEDYEALAGGKP